MKLIPAVAAVALLVLLGLWLIVRTRRATTQGVGFQEWVRNPALRRNAASHFADRDKAVARLLTRDPTKIVKMLLDDDFDIARRALKAGGPRVVPALIHALNDPRFRKPTDANTLKHAHIFDQRSQPLETVLDCLAEHAPPEAAPHLLPLVRDKDSDIRKSASLLAGAIGTDASVAPLAAACKDEDDYVRSYAMMGVLRAITDGRTSEVFRRGAFEAILPLLNRKDMSGGGGASKCLIGLDRERATRILTSPENLAVDAQGFLSTLRALREADVQVPEAQLLDLANALPPLAKKYPYDYALAEVVSLLAKVKSGNAERVITEAETSDIEMVRLAAVNAQLIRTGISNPLQHAWNAEKQRGWDGLTEPQRGVIAARTLVDEVYNGGFSQYFVNPSGSRWKHALSGFEAAKCANDVSLVRKAASAFGPNGPAEDYDQRSEQLARLVKSKGDEVFSTLDTEFYENIDDREVLMLRYIMKHPADFGGGKSG